MSGRLCAFVFAFALALGHLLLQHLVTGLRRAAWRPSVASQRSLHCLSGCPAFRSSWGARSKRCCTLSLPPISCRPPSPCFLCPLCLQVQLGCELKEVRRQLRAVATPAQLCDFLLVFESFLGTAGEGLPPGGC